jgi:hypothetical protein
MRCCCEPARRTDQLLEAAAQGDEEGVERWLKAGAEANAGSVTHDDWKGLHYAAQRGDAPVAEALLRHGAEIEAVTGRGRGCLHLAAQEGREKHVAVIDLLLSHGANVNLQTPWGSTPLQDAAYLGHVGVLRELLKHGACPHIEDQDGRNAWDTALAEREDKALDVIKEHVSAHLNARTRLVLAFSTHRRLRGTTPLRFLAQELIDKVLERIPTGMSRGSAARIYRFLKQSERERVRAAIGARAAAGAADSAAGSAASTSAPAGATGAAAALPVPFTPLNERQLKRRRDSSLFTGSPPGRSRHKD